MDSFSASDRGGRPFYTEGKPAAFQWGAQGQPVDQTAHHPPSRANVAAQSRSINFGPGNYTASPSTAMSSAAPAYKEDHLIPSAWRRSGTQSLFAPSTASSTRAEYSDDSRSYDSSSGTKPKDIWGGFTQGENGDCLTISGIKAAMMRFGQKPADVFKEVKEAGDGYDVTMRDGMKVHLSKDELEQATANSKIKGDDPEMMKDANFMYAVSAKRAQMENNDGTAAQSFAKALETLKDGEDGNEGLMRLGLKDHIKQGSVSDLQNGAIGIVNREVTNPKGETGGHSMVVVNGIEELWGTRNGLVTHGDVFLLT